MTLASRVIPCLDIKDGRVVKGVQFQGLRDAGDPVECAGLYERQGADEIVLLDVSATPEGRGHALETVRAVRSVLSIPLSVGGGVKSPDDAGRLLEAGADKVGVNTAAVSRPGLIGEIAERFGTQCTVLAVDAAAGEAGWEVVVESGRTRTGLDVVEWCRKAVAIGAGEILLTSWDRDGTEVGLRPRPDRVGLVCGDRPRDRLRWRRPAGPSGRSDRSRSLGCADRLDPS